MAQPRATRASAAPGVGGRPASRTFPGSPSLDGVVGPDGTAFPQFRRTLAPRYGRAWLDIALRWALVAAGYAVVCVASARLGVRALWLLPPAALWIGFWFASVVLFMHEGAHFNLHPDKATNDRLANVFVCWAIGNDVADYRALHWQHHLHLGDIDDTEVSYHYAPSVRFAVETLVGVHAWRVFWNHRSAHQHHEGRARSTRSVVGPVARGIAAHVVLLAVTVRAGLWPAALTWMVAVGVVFPYFSALREQLEHRALDARSGVDYAHVAHGPVNRMFAATLPARALGSAGFRQHLLHHWDPTVSYTRFDDMEAFLMSTDLAPVIDDVRTTYAEAWRRLARS
jgi:fatty acid desaturase